MGGFAACGIGIAGSWSRRTASCCAGVNGDAIAGVCTLGVVVAFITGAVQAATAAAAHSVAMRKKSDRGDAIRRAVGTLINIKPTP